jgi:multidrug resistance efflux pump
MKSKHDELVEIGKLERQRRQFEMAKQSNLVEIAEIDLELLKQERDWGGIFDAELAVTRAGMLLRRAQHNLQKMQQRDSEFRPAAEVSRLKIAHQLAELEVEKRCLQLDMLKRGPSELELREAKLALLRAVAETGALNRKHEQERVQHFAQECWAESKARYWEGDLKHRLENQEAVTVCAPCDGMVQYARTWSRDGFVKVAVGKQAGYRSRIARIVDVSQMHVEVAVPERFFSKVSRGMKVEVSVPGLSGKKFAATISNIGFAFVQKTLKTGTTSLYSMHEPLGEVTFTVRADIVMDPGVALKPGAMASVVFPFRK